MPTPNESAPQSPTPVALDPNRIIDVHDATDLIAGLGDAVDDDPDYVAGQGDAEDAAPTDALPDDDREMTAAEREAYLAQFGESEEAVKAAAEAAKGPTDTVVDSPPEFWTPEQKALWDTIPEAARSVIRDQEAQRVAFVSNQAREAAAARQRAEADAAQVLAERDQLANWWKANAQTFANSFANKWSQVNWEKLAAEHPAEWARLKQQYDTERGTLEEANRRHQAEVQAQEQRQAALLQQQKAAEHQKLIAHADPDIAKAFAAPVAQKTYEELGEYLHKTYGFAPERINSIYEAPIIEIAMKAMILDRAKAALKARQAAGTQNPKPAPRLVTPGPGTQQSAGVSRNQASEALRQARQRFKESDGSSLDDAAEMIRLQGL